MKHILSVATLIFSFVLLAGCMNNSNLYPHTNQVDEKWPRLVETSTDGWEKGASSWFMGDDPNVYKDQGLGSARDASMSTMMVDVPNFNKVKVDGPFQIQLFSSDEPNSVYLFGPNAGVRQAVVEVRGDMLCISVDPNANNIHDMRQVIIRIGVSDLKSLAVSGDGRIEGRQLKSKGLILSSEGNNNVYLSGSLILKEVKQSGDGCINIFAASASALDIKSTGHGRVNISGDLSLRKITHTGAGDINIIGANGGGLCIDASGSGKIGIFGQVRIYEINTKDKVCVYAYYVNSHNLKVTAAGSSRVGLAGDVESLHVEAYQSASFAGQNLHSRFAYAKAFQSAHINITATNRAYASAADSATIYFFGPSSILSEFVKGNGEILTIWDENATSVYKDTAINQAAVRYNQPPKYSFSEQPKKAYRHKKTRYYKSKT